MQEFGGMIVALVLGLVTVFVLSLFAMFSGTPPKE